MKGPDCWVCLARVHINYQAVRLLHAVCACQCTRSYRGVAPCLCFTNAFILLATTKRHRIFLQVDCSSLTVNIGFEQEIFLVPREAYERRQDLQVSYDCAQMHSYNRERFIVDWLIIIMCTVYLCPLWSTPLPKATRPVSLPHELF